MDVREPADGESEWPSRSGAPAAAAAGRYKTLHFVTPRQTALPEHLSNDIKSTKWDRRTEGPKDKRTEVISLQIILNIIKVNCCGEYFIAGLARQGASRIPANEETCLTSGSLPQHCPAPVIGSNLDTFTFTQLFAQFARPMQARCGVNRFG
ncbi:hypothetical protein EVAR_45541_1 [Eumeta japonica]|uniref:Uncharacterized protein n=1 Tax=Eumeta variegata TaxID=151549 RepID=A0A4C1X6F8_EUMVA|nr:hypothetical protein EVAR_45541_1 [Eumeta japonica]